MAKHYWINGSDNKRTLTFGSIATNAGPVSAMIFKSSADVTTYFGTSFKAVSTGNVKTYTLLFDKECTSGAQIQGYVLWTNPAVNNAYSNTASLTDIVYTYTPANLLDITLSTTQHVWNNQTFKVKAVGNRGTRRTSTKCGITWTHTAGSCISSIPASTANAESTITWGSDYTFTNGVAYTFTITGSHQGGDANNDAYMSASKITGTSSTISVKNAVTGISLANQGTTQYIYAGQTKTFGLTFTAKSKGAPYSYSASYSRSAGTDAVATVSLSGNSASAPGSLSVKGVAANTTLQKYQVTSSQSGSPQTSDILTIGVTAASSTASINSGSAEISFTYGAGTFVAATGVTTYVSYSANNGVAKINFKKGGGNNLTFTMLSGATYKVSTTTRSLSAVKLNTGDSCTVTVPSSATTATSSSTSVCTVSLSGTSCTIKGVSAGSATITLGNGDSFSVTISNITLSIS